LLLVQKIHPFYAKISTAQCPPLITAQNFRNRGRWPLHDVGSCSVPALLRSDPPLYHTRRAAFASSRPASFSFESEPKKYSFFLVFYCLNCNMQPAAALSPPKLVSLTISGVQPLVYQHETAKPVPHLPAAEQHCMKIIMVPSGM